MQVPVRPWQIIDYQPRPHRSISARPRRCGSILVLRTLLCTPYMTFCCRFWALQEASAGCGKKSARAFSSALANWPVIARESWCGKHGAAPPHGLDAWCFPQALRSITDNSIVLESGADRSLVDQFAFPRSSYIRFMSHTPQLRNVLRILQYFVHVMSDLAVAALISDKVLGLIHG